MWESKMKVFLDDERPTPEGWTHARFVEDAIELLKSEEVTHISLDNDLGIGYHEGYEVLEWMEREVVEKGFKPPKIRIHSMNPVRKIYMKQLAKRIHDLYEKFGSDLNKHVDSIEVDVPEWLDLTDWQAYSAWLSDVFKTEDEYVKWKQNHGEK